jgi:hypothetical protein
MPRLGAALDFVQLEARNMVAHNNGSDPATPVKGQMYFNTANNTLFWFDGSSWVAAKDTGGGAVADATTSSKGIVQLAGDLAGTASSPQIAAGVITDAEVAAANKNGANATPSMRGTTMGVAGHAVPATTDLGAFARLLPAQESISANGQQIKVLAAPTNTSDAATKLYVDQVAQGLDAKASVLAAADTNVNLAAPGTSIGGVTFSTFGSRFLAVGQTTPSQNGIYEWNGNGSPATRSFDADVWTELVAAYVWVETGTNQETGWVCTVDAGGTLGTTPVTWTQFSGAGQITAGQGLMKSGNILDVGAGAGLDSDANEVFVEANGITNAMLADGAVNLAGADVTGALPTGKGGTGATTASQARTNLAVVEHYTIDKPASPSATLTVPFSEHGCNNGRGNLVQVTDNATGATELPDVVQASNGDITISYGASVSANSKRITIVG